MRRLLCVTIFVLFATDTYSSSYDMSTKPNNQSSNAVTEVNFFSNLKSPSPSNSSHRQNEGGKRKGGIFNPDDSDESVLHKDDRHDFRPTDVKSKSDSKWQTYAVSGFSNEKTFYSTLSEIDTHKQSFTVSETVNEKSFYSTLSGIDTHKQYFSVSEPANEKSFYSTLSESDKDKQYFSVSEPVNEKSFYSTISESDKDKQYFSVSEPVNENHHYNTTAAQRHFNIYASDCYKEKNVHIFETEGYVDGVFVDVELELGENILCIWAINVPKGYSILATAILLANHCYGDTLIEAEELGLTDLIDLDYYTFKTITTKLAYIQCFAPEQKQLIATLSNSLYFIFSKRYLNKLGLESFHVFFKAVKESPRLSLPVVFETPLSGFVTSPGFSEDSQYPAYINATFQLEVPANHVVVVSFRRLDLRRYTTDCLLDKINFFTVGDNGSMTLKWSECGDDDIPLGVYSESIAITFVTFNTVHIKGGIGFKMLFSVHPASPPIFLSDHALFDCSLASYSMFKQHLECNVVTECLGGEDERNCPFSSPLCNGSVAFRHGCYTYHYTRVGLGWKDARKRCQDLGGDLAMPKTVDDMESMRKLFSYGRRTGPAFIGLMDASAGFYKLPQHCSVETSYKNTLFWVDGTVAYNANVRGKVLAIGMFGICATMSLQNLFSFKAVNCDFGIATEYICEMKIKDDSLPKSVSVPFPSLQDLEQKIKSNTNFALCNDGHVTLDFLSCLPGSFCGEVLNPDWCEIPTTRILKIINEVTSTPTTTATAVIMRTAVFVCRDRQRWLHYTMVCDFKPDCPEGSDEGFCKHYHTCPEYTCLSGQCINSKQVCDKINHCWDKSDENDCSSILSSSYSSDEDIQTSIRTPPPAIIDFDAKGNVHQASLLPMQSCPPTHFRCHGDVSYCLPIYVRCNGVYDCPDHEDEQDCEHYVCVGLYRCFNSPVCIHMDHLCDGWPQCPERDDEMLCGHQCPEECHCQGLAFICGQLFPADAYPSIRYLDAARSGLSLTNLTRNVYLLWLSLSRCAIEQVTETSNVNLQVLDLSDNMLTAVDMDVFYKLSQLRELNLAGNPIVYLKYSSAKAEHMYLQYLDLSRTAIHIFDSTALKSFRYITFLNLSYSKFEAIENSGFFHLPDLTRLDIRGNKLNVFPPDIFSRLTRLQEIHADNYKLCCKEILPEHFPENFCLAPQDELSSCEDLLRSNVYRVFSWIMATMTIIGNAGCFVFRMFFQKVHSRSGYGVFVLNLCVADFLMGLYLTLVGVADQLYLGNYLWHEVAWKASEMCTFAGFLSLLSMEVSSNVIFLITLDRFIVLRFPFGRFSFQRRSATLACGTAWIVGILLATVPLLPLTSHWQFYGQTGICIPLPLTRKDFPGRTYSFGLIIMFNFVLFILIAVGQSFIYISIQANSMTVTNTTRKAKDATIARRLTFIVVSNFLCWFPIGLVGLLTSAGTPIPSEVSVAMAIFVLPLNAALNPFAYTFNMLAEKMRKSEEDHLLRILDERLQSKKTELAVGERGEVPMEQITLISGSLQDFSDSLTNQKGSPNEHFLF